MQHTGTLRHLARAGTALLTRSLRKQDEEQTWRTRRAAGRGQLEDERAAAPRPPSSRRSWRAPAQLAGRADLMICPPATLLARFAAVAQGFRRRDRRRRIAMRKPSGAFTGDISAEMLADAGATRRDRRPFRAAQLSPRNRCRCAGQGERRLARRADGDRLRRRNARASARPARRSTCIGRQLDGSLPDGATAQTWSSPMSRSGRSAPASRRRRRRRGGAWLYPRAALVSASRRPAQAVRILYGGSVKPVERQGTVAVANVDGALVGGASLKADDFLGIARRLPLSTDHGRNAPVEMRRGIV